MYDHRDQPVDDEFAQLAAGYLDDRAERHPDAATELGDHRFDAQLASFAADALAADRQALDRWAAALSAVETSALAPEHQVDAAMMADDVARQIFEHDELREHAWNPLLANPGRAIYGLLARDFAPLPDRLASVAGRLAGTPARPWPPPGSCWDPCQRCTWRPRSPSSRARSPWSPT